MNNEVRYKDTDLREALRRRYAHTPELPADFMERMMRRMEQQERKRAKKRRLWAWVAAAACLLLIIGVSTSKHVPADSREEAATSTLTATGSQEGVATSTLVAADSREGVATSTLAAAGSQEGVATSTLVAADSREGVATSALAAADSRKSEFAVADSLEGMPAQLTDLNLHYAYCTTEEDTAYYPSPRRMDEFIVKMTEYGKVKGEPLHCAPGDTTVVSMAYVFDDRELPDVMSRLLQVACCYDAKTPGYLLNFSHKQFVFCLEDRNLKYLWIAERISGGRILLFSTHSPKGTAVSSACFQNYREQLTHKGINNLNL